MEIAAKLHPTEDWWEQGEIKVPKGTKEIKFFVQLDGGEIQEVGQIAFIDDQFDDILDGPEEV